MRLRRVLLLVVTLVVAPSASAELFPNIRKGYNFEAPASWRLAHPDYMLASPSGASLSESDLPPKGVLTLEKISKSAGMIACIGADYEDTNEQFPLDGEGWNGLVKVFVEPRRTNRQQRHVLQLVAQHGDSYRIFYLAMPTTEWKGDRKGFTAVLGSLRFQ
ncbi:hypothetical protein DFR24_0777 [Panacagrimonas perspica]|uniref:PsbP protein n=1 Tax=Panacagrimonas perspica TaxID=381431 RepID=A0A4S3JZ27_9GAMM|nr:hypothetical protein [Panacagrimonas perspica]TDU31409.1 hypothetical protein DFR24_0777 [Panacagrimonas perspica]THD00816.1 hypothetical protein B1810_23145 [Panacagrimonas perspica]